MRRIAAFVLFLFLACPVYAAPHKKVVKPTMAARVTVNADGDVRPDLRAAAAIVFDPETGTILYESNSTEQRSIALITKVMTASVFLESGIDMNQSVTILPVDTLHASLTYIRPYDVVTVDELLHLLLIASDNAAAQALARIAPLGTEKFIVRMNQKASELGLMQTEYVDTSGLLRGNVSTALDMAKLIVAVSSDDYIAMVMQIPQYSFRTEARRLVAFRSTDHLLQDVPVMAAKTGFTNPAGFCLASLLRLPF